MKHFGDITKINGHEVPIVDIITGGSPCQDLSVAGKRAGLAGERSGLFMEQIRIIKEMHDECRRSNEPIRPRFMVFENVEGLFSSNGGEDFRAVLEETARVVSSDTTIPRLPDGASWSNAGTILGDGWSIAWRVHDRQFWGVPQRRRRVSLVADFRGQSAPDIFTDEEMKVVYNLNNRRMTLHNGDEIMNNGIAARCAFSLWQRIEAEAEAAIHRDSVGADLRFGHDTNLFRLMTLMGLDIKGKPMDEILPMAANLQMIFYKNAQGKVLVQLLHNEKPAKLAGVEAIDGFYEWQTLKQQCYYCKRDRA